MSTVVPQQTASLPDPPDWIPSPLYRMTLERYEALVASGVFDEHERFHLINGLLVEKMTQNDPHATADELCGAALNGAIPAGWHVRAAKPIRIPSRSSKPEPDRCVARGMIRDYARRSPEPSDVALVVEVADSSLGEDRKQAAMYAGGGIPAYWIVNLPDRQIEVHTNPETSGYGSRQVYHAGETVPLMIEGVPAGMIAVNDLLP